MFSDIAIAQSAKLKPITEIAKNLGLAEDDLELYGKYKAKINLDVREKLKDKPDGKLVLVTAINPTPAGEGKTTTMVGLGQAMNKIGKKAIIAIREPSLGPVFGVKGGAAGGGNSQVVPMEDINLHFTGDMHAITSANNLLSALLDNHLQQGNELKIDPRQIVWKRCLDMNDRALRNIVVGLGGKPNGVPREDGFNITVASEVMAILCLSENLEDLKNRLGKIIIGYNYNNEPITAKDLQADGAMAVLLKDALKPNLVQTLENTPAIMHGGPFANIAHGCNSVQATKLALKLGDIVITEAGFGADLGAEKFFNIKCRLANLKPDAVVLVATVRALKYNGGENLKNAAVETSAIFAEKKIMGTSTDNAVVAPLSAASGEQGESLNDSKNVAVATSPLIARGELKGGALERGIVNLEKHIANLKKFGVPAVVALNKFDTDTEEEINFIKNRCQELGAEFALSEVWARGGEGGIELANAVVNILENKKSEFKVLYDVNDSIENKINKIATEIYGAKGVQFSAKAKTQIERVKTQNLASLPICMAKTQYSLSDDPTLLGRPDNFEITIREIKISAGAGFIVALAGDIMTMPGLPKHPAAMDIDLDGEGRVVGLF